MAIPKTMKAWSLQGENGFDESLVFRKDVPIPPLSDNDVLVKFHAASLNFRDLAIPLGQYPFPYADGVIPGSDGAGEVIAVGPKVTRFKAGAKVATLFNQAHQGGAPTPRILGTGLGGGLDGVLRQYGVFPEDGLVDMPSNLSYLEASTVSCAGVTAWNALYGLKPLKPGEWVLTQGTGGVSVFALQFAKAGGAKVIATTSSEKKAQLLKKLGADHVINYKETPNWGEAAKKLTTGGLGVDHVVEVGGVGTIEQSLNAVRIEGVISMIGFLTAQDGVENEPSWAQVLLRDCIVRGVIVGSRVLHEEMNRAIETYDIKPAVDEKLFKLEDLKDAYKYLWSQKHVGKVCIQID